MPHPRKGQSLTGPIQNSSTVGPKVVFSKVLPKGIAIDFDAEPAALTGLPEGKQEGT